jgi:hypothetical protein
VQRPQASPSRPQGARPQAQRPRPQGGRNLRQ